MKKLGLICLVLCVALASLSVAYASWSQNLTVNGKVSTGTFDVQFQQAVSNDGTRLSDPTVQGSWSWTGGTLAATNWTGARATDKASTTVSGAGSGTLTITISSAYVGYWSSVGCTLKNTGSIPIKVDTVTYTVTPPAGRSASDVSVYFSDALVAASHTQIDVSGVNSEKLGAIYVRWNSVPTISSTYTLNVTITATQWNMVP
jgi:predicted ribosomally synthesized peptide with SipW-like signal peptide